MTLAKHLYSACNHLTAEFINIIGSTSLLGASLIAQLVKNLPLMQETPVRFLGQEDVLEMG